MRSAQTRTAPDGTSLVDNGAISIGCALAVSETAFSVALATDGERDDVYPQRPTSATMRATVDGRRGWCARAKRRVRWHPPAAANDSGARGGGGRQRSPRRRRTTAGPAAAANGSGARGGGGRQRSPRRRRTTAEPAAAAN